MQYKFRGKRIDNGEWIYGYYHKAVSDGYARHYILPEVMWAHNHEFEVIPETVGQYIGHKDEVNAEIYYGDIIDNDDYIFLIRNALYGCYLEQLRCPEDEEDEDWSAYLNTHPVVGNSKVIGNIHDNPELLTQ